MFKEKVWFSIEIDIPKEKNSSSVGCPKKVYLSRNLKIMFF